MLHHGRMVAETRFVAAAHAPHYHRPARRRAVRRSLCSRAAGTPQECGTRGRKQRGAAACGLSRTSSGFLKQAFDRVRLLLELLPVGLRQTAEIFEFPAYAREVLKVFDAEQIPIGLIAG